MADAFYGEIRMFGFGWPPADWVLCHGQLLAINQNPALYAIIGTIYGGDGRNTMAVPSLVGRAPMDYGTGPALTPRTLGEYGGKYAITLNPAHIPAHTHDLYTRFTTNIAGVGEDASGKFISRTGTVGGPRLFYNSPPGGGQLEMSEYTLADTGLSHAHENRQPYLPVSFCMCTYGQWPSRS